MGHGQKRQPRNEFKRLQGEDRWEHHPKSGGARSPRGVPRGVRGIPGQSVAGAAKSSAQAADAELKSCDGAKTMSEMEASVPSEQELRLAAEAVEKQVEADMPQAELALLAGRQHRLEIAREAAASSASGGVSSLPARAAVQGSALKAFRQ